MITPSAVLVAAAIAVAFIPRLGSVIQEAAIRFQDQAGCNATVLTGAHITHPVALSPAEPTAITRCRATARSQQASQAYQSPLHLARGTTGRCAA